MSRRLAIPALALLIVSACGAGRYLPFGGARDATLLVRHQQTRTLEVWSDGERLGVAEVGRVACFRDLEAGTRRVRATVVGDTVTVRATRIVLAPEHPMLWDVDHDQLLEGRVYERYCEESEDAP